MLAEREYAEFLHSYTNGFDINQSIIVPLIRIHAPSENEEQLEEDMQSSHDEISDSMESLQDLVDEDSSFDKQQTIHHERDCYLMPYCYNDIRSMYMMLPRSRSKSLPHVVSSSPTLCETCKGYVQIPEHASLHRRKSAPVTFNSLSLNSLVAEEYTRKEPIVCDPTTRETLCCPAKHRRSTSFSYLTMIEADNSSTDLFQLPLRSSDQMNDS